MNNLPTVTKKQRDTVDLLHSYRFLNRIQIQTFLKHKDYKTINLWLRDLLDKQYVGRIYSTDFAERTKPAIYYLSLNGIRHLKAMDFHSVEELGKRYREPTRAQAYIDRCLLLADCAITLEQARNEDDWPQSWYYIETEADYMSDSFYHFLADSQLAQPHLCYSKELYEWSEPFTTESYFMEIFDPGLPRYRVKKRLSDYIEFLDSGEWEDENKGDKLPIIQLVCPRISDLIYAKRRTRGLLSKKWEYDDENRPHIQFTTIDKLKKLGILAKEIWEEA
jgi:hypothetical protein